MQMVSFQIGSRWVSCDGGGQRARDIEVVGFPVEAGNWVGEVFDYVAGAKAVCLDFLDV